MRLNLQAILSEFLDFREEVVTRRFQFELAELRVAAPHPEGFAILFDALDEAIRLMPQVRGQGRPRPASCRLASSSTTSDRCHPGDEVVQAGAPGNAGESATSWPRSRRARQGDRSHPERQAPACGR